MSNLTKPETAFDFCKDLMRWAFAVVDEALIDFFLAIGKSEGELPDNLKISTAKWNAAIDEIEAAAGAQDIEATVALCQQFEKRALATIEDRKRKLGIVSTQLKEAA